MFEQFVLKPSKTFTSLLLLVHSLAIASVWLTQVALWWQLALFLLISLSLIRSVFRYALLRDDRSWLSFSLTQKHLLIHTQGGKELNGEILHRTVVTPHCVVLCVRLDGTKLPVSWVIFRDALQDDVFRELRVRLRFY